MVKPSEAEKNLAAQTPLPGVAAIGALPGMPGLPALPGGTPWMSVPSAAPAHSQLARQHERGPAQAGQLSILIHKVVVVIYKVYIKLRACLRLHTCAMHDHCATSAQCIAGPPFGPSLQLCSLSYAPVQVVEPFGALETVQVPVDEASGQCKGFGFVTVSTSLTYPQPGSCWHTAATDSGLSNCLALRQARGVGLGSPCMRRATGVCREAVVVVMNRFVSIARTAMGAVLESWRMRALHSST